MEKRIIINNGGGTVAVIIPATKCGLTLEEIIAKDIPRGAKYRVVNVSALPVDRTFRGAWTDDNPTETVDVDILRAKRISHNYRRCYRDKLMSPLDKQITIPGKESAIELKREGIRKDNAIMQKNIDKAKTVKDLKIAIESIIMGV